MSRKIYTYSKLDTIEKSKYFNEYSMYPQVTVSSEIAWALNCEKKVFGGKIYEFKRFMYCLTNHVADGLLNEGWYSEDTRFRMMAVLNRFLREKINSANSLEEKRWILGCKRNVNSILYNIIKLEEANVLPSDIIVNDRDVALLVDAWNYLFNNDPAIKEFRKVILSLEDSKFLISFLKEVFEIEFVEKIIFHGFYYFSPIQQSVLDAIEACGIDTIFLIPYEERYPYANQIWRENYSVEKGYPDFNEWCIEEGVYTLNVLGEIFENRKCNAANIKLYEYKSSMEFVKAAKHIAEKGGGLYSTDDKSVNKLLKDYYPEAFGERTLLSYPIGQFVYSLHEMWDDGIQGVSLNEALLKKCFASGWLSVNGKSSIDYTLDLEWVLPFFSGCSSVSEWNDRIVLLNDIRENAISKFGTVNSDDRWKVVLGNPLHNFSMFALDDDRLFDVLELISQLIRMANALFGKDEPISISKHMKNLELVLSDKKENSEQYVEEQQIIDKLFECIGSNKRNDLLCFPGDIAGAMKIYLDGGLDKGELQNHHGDMVYTLYQIDAACINKHGNVHICMADVNKVPGSDNEPQWPLSLELIESTYQQCRKSSLETWLFGSKLMPIANRYFIYSAIKNKCVEISWISQVGEKKVAPSPYITLLHEVAGIEIVNSDTEELNFNTIVNVVKNNKIERNYDITKRWESLVKDAKLEYSLCPMRYVFGYILNEYPTFNSAFQQSAAIKGLIAGVSELLEGKANKDDIANQIFELFPNLRKAEKRQIMDYSSKMDIRKHIMKDSMTVYQDYEYTDERLKIVFSNSDLLDMAYEVYGRLMSQDGLKGINPYSPPQIERFDGSCYEPTCMYCPHSSYCRNAQFGGDINPYDK